MSNCLITACYRAEIRPDLSFRKETPKRSTPPRPAAISLAGLCDVGCRPNLNLLFDTTDLPQGSHVTRCFASFAATSAFQQRYARSSSNRNVDKALEWLIDHIEEFQAASGNPGSRATTVLPSASPALTPQSN